MIDTITLAIESLDRGWLRDTLVSLREELRSDPFAIAFWCEFEPARAERLIGELLGVLSERP